MQTISRGQLRCFRSTTSQIQELTGWKSRAGQFSPELSVLMPFVHHEPDKLIVRPALQGPRSSAPLGRLLRRSY